jgi:hypothetical protein
MFWTIQSGIPVIGQPVTACERHALKGVNEGSAPHGLGPWESMIDAVLELEAIIATFGGNRLGVEITSSEVGHCPDCQAEMEAFEAEHRESA